jgi:hypothetical protein
MARSGWTAALAAVVVVAGCSTTTQMTSGTAYLDAYPPAALKTGLGVSDVDADVRAIAAVEPDLRFPARIGLARIEGAQLTAAPPEELAHWSELAERLGAEVGEFIPVSPLIAEMVDPTPPAPPAQPAWNPETGRYEAAPAAVADIVGHIRRGAARQHLDYVLVYEVTTDWSQSANALSLADISLLGLFVLPRRNVEVEAAANALLLDVRNGYPYGTASAYAERNRAVRAVYAWNAQENIAPDASLDAVAELTGEVETMIGDLRAELARTALAKR